MVYIDYCRIFDKDGFYLGGWCKSKLCLVPKGCKKPSCFQMDKIQRVYLVCGHHPLNFKNEITNINGPTDKGESWCMNGHHFVSQTDKVLVFEEEDKLFIQGHEEVILTRKEIKKVAK